jgi:hypothetical protein
MISNKYNKVALHKNIEQRLKALKFNLDDLNNCYSETLKDSYIECGIEYNKKYPYNQETLDLIKQPEILNELRKDKLFCSILNFTQTYYSIKEYLRKEYPQNKKNIENFFSEKSLGIITRKGISNDLKHNPQNDIVYKFGVVGKEKIIEPGKITEVTHFKHTWFYAGLDSVDLCNNLYIDLIKFIEENIQ